MVPKSNGKWKTCIDFINFKKACPKASFPLPHIDQLANVIIEHELLSFMDAYSECNQIPMFKLHEEYTSSITDRRLYCYKAIPFGLKNAGTTYQKLMNMMFKDLIGKTMEVYGDNILVKSKVADNHMTYLGEMFIVLRRYQMKLNPLKCAFGVGLEIFLQFMVN